MAKSHEVWEEELSHITLLTSPCRIFRRDSSSKEKALLYIFQAVTTQEHS